MLDYALLDSEEGLDRLRTGFEARGFDGNGLIDLAIAARTEARNASRALYEAREQKNTLSREFGERKKKGEATYDIKEQTDKLALDIAMLEEMERANMAALRNAVALMPNIPDDNVPVGDETNNRELPNPLWLPETAKPDFDFKPKDHVTIGTKMEGIDFERAAAMSGARFACMSGAIAKLERVLGQWMLDEVIARNYTEVSVPHLVKAETMFGTGQLPKFEEDLFKTTDGRYLIPTAEVPLTNMIRERVLEVADDGAKGWSMRLCALTPCYRAEAGSAGRDTRGLLRMHQFNKVEMVCVCSEGQSENEHEYMLNVARNILYELGLSFRTVLLSAGDMGFSARKTYDLEVWIPSENKYREIASISNCGDFQTRRMNARWKWKGQKGTSFGHSLNGSGVAVGRALLAIIENYQTEQGAIAIPLVLRDRMGGSIIDPTGKVI
jgi:seryl-tRNA synthetase